jgi:hypothetical protein
VQLGGYRLHVRAQIAMKEIKFRAWNNLREEMGSAMPLDVIVKSAVMNPIETDWWNEEKLEIMQFPGLRDKKGKEIYEGDYVTAGLEIGVGQLLQKTEGEVHYVESCGTYCISTPEEDGGHIGKQIVSATSKSSATSTKIRNC